MKKLAQRFGSFQIVNFYVCFPMKAGVNTNAICMDIL
jgi:hypothetical protein